MKNSLSHIYYALQELRQAQPDSPRAWADGVQVIETADAVTKEPVWWIRQEALEEQLANEHLVELKTIRALIANRPEKKKLGRTTVTAYGIRLRILEKHMRDKETTLSKTQALSKRVRELESELKVAREHNALGDAMARMLERLDKQFKLKPMAPFAGFKPQKARKFTTNAGVATLFLSDWHYGEVVDAEQTGGLNDYNIAIADARAKRVFAVTQDILLNRQAGATFDGLVIAFGGDMVSGNIHEELRHTNEKNVLQCSMELAEKVTAHIVQIADNFPAVYVPMVAGNHGRLDLVPKFKNATSDNFDTFTYWLIEKFTRMQLGNKCNVTFDIATGPELRFKVYGTRYLLTHGDSERGSTCGDFWSSMAKAALRKQSRALRARVEDFDYMMCGHFHRYSTVSNVIVNGSLKGYDELGFKEVYEFEQPIQALWLTDPFYGITAHMPLYAEEAAPDARHNAAPITYASAYTRKRTN